jgi:hypothetical protein
MNDWARCNPSRILRESAAEAGCFDLSERSSIEAACSAE